MSMLSQFLGGGIKSIQRGTVTISGAGASATATITAVDTAKSVLHFLGSTDSGSNNYSMGYLSLTNPTTVTATRNSGSGSPTTVVSFQVVEYY